MHLHCHQKATSDVDCDLEVLERLGVEAKVIDSGCCGFAGSFGYEAGDPYDVAVRVGERTLLPAVRDASPETVIPSDGFSCRSQIEHGSERSALHLAKVAHAALRRNRGGAYPKRAAPPVNGARPRRAARAGAVVASMGALVRRS